MKKQIAVEWLISHLQKSKDWQRVLNEVNQMSTVKFDLLDQAKAMEKTQILDAYVYGSAYGTDTKQGFSAVNYFESTYGK